MQKTEFKKTVWQYYHQNGRDLPWRQPEQNGQYDPYKILVSEIMLQQTQVMRVIPKYHEFLKRFPSLAALARASLAEVLTVWLGLGYNRRARYLHEAAEQLAMLSEVPRSIELLERLPGIGKNTAAAVVVYSFNQPAIFIETNVRSVYLHHFFAGQQQVSDQALLPFITATLDQTNPRQWYWALMDYGSYLKRTQPNPNKRSKHYATQAAFQGSVRELRGQILKLLAINAQSEAQLKTLLADKRLEPVLETLRQEGLVVKVCGKFCLPK